MILTFNASHKDLKEAIKRAAELAQALDADAAPRHQRARSPCSRAPGRSSTRSRTSPTSREHAAQLEDILQRETFFRDLAAIDQHTTRSRTRTPTRHTAAVDGAVRGVRSCAAPQGNTRLGAARRRAAGAGLGLLRSRAADDGDGIDPIPLLREQTQACEVSRQSRGGDAANRRRQPHRALDVASYFAGGIETEEQLEAALEGLRERVAELIAAGKKVLIQ